MTPIGLYTSVWQIQNSNTLRVNGHLLDFICINLAFDLTLSKHSERVHELQFSFSTPHLKKVDIKSYMKQLSKQGFLQD